MATNTTSDFDLNGRVAIITGAGRGLGRAHALLLAERGARVVVNDAGGTKDGFGDSELPAEEVVSEIRAAGGQAVANTADIGEWDGVDQLVRQAVNTYGDLHIVVNNAGFLRDRRVYNMTEEAWDAVINVHLKGTFAVTHFASAYWKDQKASGNSVDASIINTSSEAGVFCSPGQSAYGTAKAAILALTLICAKDLRSLGVRVNAICPNARTRLTVETASSHSWATAEVPDGAFDVLDPANISPVVAYLAAPGCPLTGAVLGAVGGRITLYEGWSEAKRVDRDNRWTVEDLATELVPWFDETRPALSDGRWARDPNPV